MASYAASQERALKDQLRNETDPVKQQALKGEIDKWGEGGMYRVALHTVAGALGGGLSGVAGSAVSGASANLMEALQDNIQQGLEAAGLGDAAAKGIAQGIATLTAAGMGAAVGGVQGAASAATVDANNRQLHPSEEKWLKEKAKDFAKKEGISEQEATARLTQQALRDVDYLWRAQLADGDDAAAKGFLSTNQQTFTNDLGEQQKLFTATGQQLFRPEMFADTANPHFYKQFAQSGIARDLTTGLMKELRDSGVDIKNSAIDLAQAAKDRPAAILAGVWEAVMNLPQSVVDGFRETGTAIGESAAVVLNQELTDKLDAIYGTDTAGAQKALLAIRITTSITGTAGAVKAGAQLSESAAKAVDKKLDDVAREKAEAQAVAKAKTKNNSRVDDGQQYDQYRDVNSDGWDWQKQAPNDGAVPGTARTTVIKKNDSLDRYGSRSGEYFSPAGTPFEQRSLPPGKQADPYEKYTVLKEFAVVQEEIAPAFNQPGGGLQLRAKIPEVQNRHANINDLIRFGYLNDPKGTR